MACMQGAGGACQLRADLQTTGGQLASVHACIEGAEANWLAQARAARTWGPPGQGCRCRRCRQVPNGGHTLRSCQCEWPCSPRRPSCVRRHHGYARGGAQSLSLGRGTQCSEPSRSVDNMLPHEVLQGEGQGCVIAAKPARAGAYQQNPGVWMHFAARHGWCRRCIGRCQLIDADRLHYMQRLSSPLLWSLHWLAKQKVASPCGLIRMQIKCILHASRPTQQPAGDALHFILWRTALSLL